MSQETCTLPSGMEGFLWASSPELLEMVSPGLLGHKLSGIWENLVWFFFLYKICGDLVVSKIYLLDIVHELDAQDESNIAPDSRGWWKSDLSPWALDTRIPPYKFSWCMFPSSLFLSTFLKPLFFMLLSHFVSLAAFTSPILSSVSVSYLDEIFPNR